MLIKVRNKLPGYLELSPLKNHAGAPLVLHGKAEAEIAESDLEHPLIQRVIRAGWLERVPAPSSKPAAAPAPAEPPAPTPVAASAASAQDAALKMSKKKGRAPVIKTVAPADELVVPDVPSNDTDVSVSTEKTE